MPLLRCDTQTDLLEQWGALNKKIEKWIVRGSEMQCVREQCMLKHAEAQANEQVKLASEYCK